MLGIGTWWEAEESGLGRAEKNPLSLRGSKACVGLSFWKMGDFRMATNRHHLVLGCRQRPDLMLAPWKAITCRLAIINMVILSMLGAASMHASGSWTLTSDIPPAQTSCH